VIKTEKCKNDGSQRRIRRDSKKKGLAFRRRGREVRKTSWGGRYPGRSPSWRGGGEGEGRSGQPCENLTQHRRRGKCAQNGARRQRNARNKNATRTEEAASTKKRKKENSDSERRDTRRRILRAGATELEYGKRDLDSQKRSTTPADNKDIQLTRYAGEKVEPN